ncbi:MAG TPA: J domain-containing protein [Egibacteraceae bacterium]|nr:J domain-containing protein [Egibacteraceae bacterium]
MPTDHYLALGVGPDASPDEVRAAYLRLMRANHPDLRPGDLAAAETARRVNAAYHVLGDGSRRARYHRLHTSRTAGAISAADRVEALRAQALAYRAYSDEQRGYRQAFSAACLRVGAAIVVTGAAVLLLLA